MLAVFFVDLLEVIVGVAGKVSFGLSIVNRTAWLYLLEQRDFF